jgi:hypothetical protein
VGRKTEGRRVLRALEARARDRYVSPYHLAVVHAGLGQRDAAFVCLEEALRQRTPVLLHSKVDPRLAPLRDDPRFHELLRRVGLD